MKRFTPLLTVMLLVGVGGDARAEDSPCRLSGALKVRVEGAFVTLPAGTDIRVLDRRDDWSDVLTPRGPGVAATTLLEARCSLGPRPPREAPPEAKKPEPKKPEPKPKAAKTPKAPKAPPPPPPPSATPVVTPPSLPPPPSPPLAPPIEPITAPATPPPVTTPPPVATTPPAASAPTTTSTTTTTTVTEGRRVLRVAVHELTADAEDARLARVTTDALIAELRKLQRLSVIGMDEVKALLDLEAEKQLTGCTDDSCIAEIAEALGADVLVIGQIATVGGQRVFGLKRLDARAAQATGQVNQPLDLDDTAVLAMVGPAIEQLFPDVPLRDGETRGVADTLHLRLKPPPVPVWATASVAAAGLGAGLVAGGAVVVNQLARSEGLALAKASTLERPVTGAQLVGLEQSVQQSFVVAVAAGVTGAVLGAGAAVMALFTDWEGYATEDDSVRTPGSR